MRKKEKNLSRKVEVDISGGIGLTSVPTVFAFSNGKSYSIIISSKSKQSALRVYRERHGRSHDFYFKFYIAGLVILLMPFLTNFEEVVLDIEIYKQDNRVRIALSEKFKSSFDCTRISFRQKCFCWENKA